MVTPKIQQNILCYFKNDKQSMSEQSSHDLNIERSIIEYYSTNIHKVLKPSSRRSSYPKKKRNGYKSGIITVVGKKTKQKDLLVQEYRRLICATSNSKPGILFADVHFPNKTIKKANISVLCQAYKESCEQTNSKPGILFADVHFPNETTKKANISVLCQAYKESCEQAIRFKNIHEDKQIDFWNAILGLYLTRSYITNPRKKKLYMVDRYFPKAGDNSSHPLIFHVLNHGETSPPKRVILKKKASQEMNRYPAKNKGGRIIHLRNVLNKKERLGLAIISILQTLVCPGGETKGNACRINGKPTVPDMMRTMDIAPFMESTGCAPSRILKLRISDNCARMYYVASKDNRTTSFQCSRFFSRHIFRSTNKTNIIQSINNDLKDYPIPGMSSLDAMPYVTAYLLKLKEIANTYFHHFMDDFDVNSYWNSTLDLASNVINVNNSKAHLHMDTKSSFPAILSSMNPNPRMKWKGGELFVSNAGLVINYSGGMDDFDSGGDLIIMDADQLAHSVLPIVPEIQKHGEDIVRISHVLYNNGPRSIPKKAKK